MSLFRFDLTYRKRGFRLVAGVDEAGRGSLAGPVVAGAVILSEGFRIEGLDDSKKLSPQKRSELFWQLILGAEDIGFGIVDVEEIERINILEATKKAMIEAINGLKKVPDIVLIDALKLPISTKQISVVKGDQKSASIAAASIIAKVLRDWIMEYYDSLYPAYGFKKHKGYGTVIHKKNLRIYGLCPIHRRTFGHVMELVLPFDKV
ncbi:MAG: ribonuclease HII [Thermodesulfovibrionales bacterium]|nr:ribonuclease HII [Thermodesulfovibrionales bacterium]